MPQRIVHVYPGSLAARSGIREGETMISINRTPVLDLVDYQYLTARPSLEMLLEDESGTQHVVHIHKLTEESLGLTLESSLMSCPKTCANHCMFCFIEQMPPGMRPSLYVRDDDWRLSLMAGNFVTLTNLPACEMDRMIERKASPAVYLGSHDKRRAAQEDAAPHPRRSNHGASASLCGQQHELPLPGCALPNHQRWTGA